MKKIASLLALLMTVTTFSACAPKNETPGEENTNVETGTENKTTYDNTYEADVVIIGAGGGGLATALEAVEQGAEKVIIVEKLNMTGGSLNTTSGTISGAETIIQELDGLTEDSLALYKEDLMNEGSKLGGVVNEEFIDLYVKEAKETVNWLWEMGLKDYEFKTDEEGRKSVFAPEHTLYSYPRSYKPAAKDPAKYKSAVHEILDGLVNKEEKIEIHFNTEALHLIGNDKGQVLEVEALDKNEDKTNLYKAKKGIVVSTGGYSANADLINLYNSEIKGVISGGLAGANGYGLYMMQEIGGALNEASMGWVPTFPMGLENPKEPGTGRIMTTKTQFAGGILVNAEGKRFVNENHMDNTVREFELEKQTDGIQWEIYTDKIVEDILATPMGGMYKFFFAEDIGKDYIKSASSLEELAETIGVPVEALKTTVEEYNSHVDAEDTDEFGRAYTLDGNPFNLAVNKIEGDTYHAVIIKPLALLTLGGIQTDIKMNVLNAEGNPIPGLYAAGEVVGGAWGRYVSSGVGVMGPIVQGQEAAKAIMSNDLTEGSEIKIAENLIDKKFFEKKESGSSFDIDFDAKYVDGVYEAEVDGQEGPMKVQVEIKNEAIEKVEILSHNETESIAGEALKKIPEKINETKSLKDFEVISGATYTCNRIMEAILKALEGAKK